MLSADKNMVGRGDPFQPESGRLEEVFLYEDILSLQAYSLGETAEEYSSKPQRPEGNLLGDAHGI